MSRDPIGADTASKTRRDDRTRAIATGILPAVFFMHFDKQMFVVLAPSIQREFGLDIMEMAHILSAAAWCYALFQLPGAWFSRWVGPRIAIACCLIAWSLVVFVTPWAGAPLALLVLRALMGALQAPDWLSSISIVKENVAAAHRSRASSALLGAGYLGAILSGPVTAFLAARWGWRTPFLATGALGVWLGIIAYRSAARSKVGERQSSDHKPAWPAMRRALRRPAVHALALVYLLFSGVQSFVYILLPLYLADVWGLTLSRTGWLAAMPFIALTVAVGACGMGSDAVFARTRSLFRARVPAGVSAMACSGLCFILAMSSGSVAIVMIWICVGMAMVGVGQVILWSMVQDQTAGLDGFAIAWVQILGASGLAIMPLLVAATVHQPHDWGPVRWLFAAAAAGAALCLWIAQIVGLPEPLSQRPAVAGGRSARDVRIGRRSRST